MRRSGQHITAVLLAIAIALLTALSVAGAQHVSSPVHTGPTPPPPPFAGTPIVTTPTPTKGGTGSSFHTLTTKQKKQIATVLKKDSTLKKLTKGKSYKIKAETVWVTRTGSTLGGIVTLRFKKVARLKGTFIELAYDCSEHTSPPYKRVFYKATYGGVTVMSVYVDLKHKQVAGMRPFGYVIGKPKYPVAYHKAQSSCTG